MHEDIIVVLKSTVPIGTGAAVKKYLAGKTQVKFYVVNNPEFLKEGSAVNDFMHPERVVLGTDSDYAYEILDELYEPFTLRRKRTIRTSNESAEVVKYAANCFLATKISFMNEIARLCDLVGADVEEVRHGISTDSRIGDKFLYPGPGYGGSCFPKDVKALSFKGKELGLDFKIINAAEDVNKTQKTYMFPKMEKYFNGDLKGKTFAIWGTAFKANTDDIRETAAIDMTKALNDKGASVRFYDPEAADNFENLAKETGMDAKRFNNKYEILDGCDGLIVLTEWKEFRVPDFMEIKSRLKEPVIFDGRNLFNTKHVLEADLKYFAVGKAI